MEPPLRLPTRTDARDRTEVWLKLPQGSAIETRFLLEQERYVLRYPAGTVAARVELVAYPGGDRGPRWGVADVRSTRFDEGSEFFSAFRPTFAGPDAPLRGWEWRRGDDAREQLATEKLSELVAQLTRPEHRPRAVARARANNACASCHVYTRPANRRPREQSIVNRATDDSGFFQVASVLEDVAPVENYRPRDANVGDPFVTFECRAGSGAIDLVADRQTPRCADGSVPFGRFDTRAALASNDDRARRLCRARAYVYEHLDEPGRRAFGKAVETCGVTLSRR